MLFKSSDWFNVKMLFKAKYFKTLTVLLFLFPFFTYSDQAQKEDYSLLILGDSLSAAYGLTQEQGWVYLLQNAWREEDKPISVINAAISGDTTDGGLARLPRLIELHQPSHVLIELGGNDALQGHNPKKIKANIQKMIDHAKQNKVNVMVQQMQIPTNYGRRYTQMFSDVFQQVASENKVPTIPFFLEEIALDPKLMQRDGIHPTAEAQPMIMNFMKTQFEALILEN